MPITEALTPEHVDAVITEVFGPFQVLMSFDDSSLDLVLDACERLSHHLTAAVVSTDVRYRERRDLLRHPCSDYGRSAKPLVRPCW